MCAYPAFYQHTGRCLFRTLVFSGNGFYHKSSPESHGHRHTPCFSRLYVRRSDLRTALPVYPQTSPGLSGRIIRHLCDRRDLKLSGSGASHGKFLRSICLCSSFLYIQLRRDYYRRGAGYRPETDQSAGCISGKVKEAVALMRQTIMRKSHHNK